MSAPKMPADSEKPSDGTRDTVAIHAGTARLISDTIDRIFGTASEAGSPVEHEEPEEATV